MPYSSNSELPDSVKNKIPSEEGRSLWRRVFNGALRSERGESYAFAVAYTALENAGYEQRDGKYQKLFKADLEKIEPTVEVKIDAEIKKSDDELRVVYGWASVVENADESIVDWHDDVITVDDIVSAAHDYVTNSRKAKVMHNGGAIGHVVESLVFTKEIQEALGISLNKVGWFIGMKITDDEYYQKVKCGEYKMFSIGGMGQRMELDD
jgi:cation transport regulator ChaB